MGFFSNTLSVLFGMALLGALGIGGYVAVTCIVERLRSLDFQVTAVTTGASVVALLAARIIASSMRQTGKQCTVHQLHADKTATYQLFIDLWGGCLRYGRSAEDRSPDKVSKELLALDRQLMLYGSAGVVKAYAALRALERDSGTHNPQVRSQAILFGTLFAQTSCLDSSSHSPLLQRGARGDFPGAGGREIPPDPPLQKGGARSRAFQQDMCRTLLGRRPPGSSWRCARISVRGHRVSP